MPGVNRRNTLSILSVLLILVLMGIYSQGNKKKSILDIQQIWHVGLLNTASDFFAFLSSNLLKNKQATDKNKIKLSIHADFASPTSYVLSVTLQRYLNILRGEFEAKKIFQLINRPFEHRKLKLKEEFSEEGMASSTGLNMILVVSLKTESTNIYMHHRLIDFDTKKNILSQTGSLNNHLQNPSELYHALERYGIIPEK